MRLPFVFGVCLSVVAGGDACAFTAYVSNEKGNTVSVIDTNKWEVVKTIKVGQTAARHRHSPRIRNTCSSRSATTTRSR